MRGEGVDRPTAVEQAWERGIVVVAASGNTGFQKGKGAPGLADLGITPTPLEAIIPTYLYPYRKGGQYAELYGIQAAAYR